MEQGNEMNTCVDDLAALIETSDVIDAYLVGHSTGAGEFTRYFGCYGTPRTAGNVLVNAIPPLKLRTGANPAGPPFEVFGGIRATSRTKRLQRYRDLTSGPFFGAKWPASKVSQMMMDAVWFQGMHAGHKNAYECINGFPETGFTEDLDRFDVHTPTVHVDDDRIVPNGAKANLEAKLVGRGATLRFCQGA